MPSDERPFKRLKRGLKDLSPLFQNPSSSAPAPSIHYPTPDFGVEFLAVCVPDREGDAFLANAYIASRLVRQTSLSATLLSIVPGMNVHPSQAVESFPAMELLDERLSRLKFSHQELWRICRSGHEDAAPKAGSPSFKGHLVFLDFEPTQFRSLARIALLLDRLVLFVEPCVASLREAYRMMKIFWSLNREIDFFLLFREKKRIEKKEELLFERFCLITSRFMGVSPGWLGGLSFPEGNPSSEISSSGENSFQPESLLSPEGLTRPLSPEKFRFSQVLQKAFAYSGHEPSFITP